MDHVGNQKGYPAFGGIKNPETPQGVSLKHPKPSNSGEYAFSIALGAVLSQYVDNIQLELILNACISIVTVWVTKKALTKK